MNKEVIKVFLWLKLKEIGEFLLKLLGICAVVAVGTGLVWLFLSTANLWVLFLFYMVWHTIIVSAIILTAGMLLASVYCFFKDWIKSNWKEANRIVAERNK